MEFGFEPVCDQVRAGSKYLDMPIDSSNLLEPGIWLILSKSSVSIEVKQQLIEVTFD